MEGEGPFKSKKGKGLFKESSQVIGHKIMGGTLKENSQVIG